MPLKNNPDRGCRIYPGQYPLFPKELALSLSKGDAEGFKHPLLFRFPPALSRNP